MRRKIQLAVAAAAVAATVWSGCSRENNIHNMEVQYGKKDTVKLEVNF
jgi:outer membrane murein-binding lipoprotein Lpp